MKKNFWSRHIRNCEQAYFHFNWTIPTEVPGQWVISFSSEYMTVCCIYGTVPPLNNRIPITIAPEGFAVRKPVSNSTRN